MKRRAERQMCGVEADLVSASLAKRRARRQISHPFLFSLLVSASLRKRRARRQKGVHLVSVSSEEQVERQMDVFAFIATTRNAAARTTAAAAALLLARRRARFDGVLLNCTMLRRLERAGPAVKHGKARREQQHQQKQLRRDHSESEQRPPWQQQSQKQCTADLRQRSMILLVLVLELGP